MKNLNYPAILLGGILALTLYSCTHANIERDLYKERYDKAVIAVDSLEPAVATLQRENDDLRNAVNRLAKEANHQPAPQPQCHNWGFSLHFKRFLL